MSEPVIRCYAEGHANEWRAVCLDYDIAVEGRSFREVYDSLLDAVFIYVQRAQELPEAERAKLLRRAAPLPERLKMFWWAVRASQFGSDKDDNCRASFTVPCAA
ncbi:MAG: hypothetical protein EXQ89_02080 [Rhodospirillaceae bacterium]|nr:hypothetical protein [Rhodospirillaceae bacterium]